MSTTCSVFSLCLAAVATMMSVAFVGIAFSTDNWLHVTVDRPRLEDYARSSMGTEAMREALKTDTRYFDRVRGIFRICFPHGDKPEPVVRADSVVVKQRPLRAGTNPSLYLNPIDEWCTNIDYYMQVLDHGLLPEQLTRDGQVWFHFARTSVAAFCLYFMFAAIACVTGLMGCWKASGDHLISTASLMLLASLFGSAGMGFWHGAHFYEVEKVYDARLEFFPTWPEVLQASTSFSIGWSYILAWIGVGVAFLASLAYSTAAICIRTELNSMKRKAENMIGAHHAHQNPGAHHQICQHPQLFHPQFMPRPTSAAAHSYMGGSQISLNHPEMPPMPMHPAVAVASGYYSVGYPAMPAHNVYNEAVDTRTLQYKSVVKELEDAKL